MNIIQKCIEDNKPMCRCGKVHDDPLYGHYDYWHCNCEHREFWYREGEDDAMCSSCGRVVDIILTKEVQK